MILPLPVLGEIEFGVANASPEHRPLAEERFNDLFQQCELLLPDRKTATSYARVRLNISFPPSMSRRRETHLLNDLWIAALCLQHRLPLLTNDKDFDGIEGLELIHW